MANESNFPVWVSLPRRVFRFIFLSQFHCKWCKGNGLRFLRWFFGRWPDKQYHIDCILILVEGEKVSECQGLLTNTHRKSSALTSAQQDHVFYVGSEAFLVSIFRNRYGGQQRALQIVLFVDLKQCNRNVKNTTKRQKF